ncbi:pyridoxamine 5'-phosphate oxidase family protein [Branchiibius sp. NY16-3462-2]|uniref:pyridoxamine 5'-phosphate oxidase family protein n=1 Tax=Branchiibius sp. NY16-3462-2 TaxID=1807500 RepID=UPI000794C822|nr:pyridoxamine 5'-phosphate oxidase family protein [Branchiibius sp. NY16-3462-2]KYH43589.1 hypothetical protein AZH51_03795 [Branchiibius sp. NY16-3462-2]
MARDEDLKTIHDLIKDEKVAMVTTRNEGTGALTSRPMTTQEAQFDGTLYFIVTAEAGTVSDLQSAAPVNVAYRSSSAFVSLSGTGRVGSDPEKAKELWDDSVAAWFEVGPEDPQVQVLTVEVDGAEYWSVENKAALMIDLVKARVTGKRPDVGENDTVDL